MFDLNAVSRLIHFNKVPNVDFEIIKIHLATEDYASIKRILDGHRLGVVRLPSGSLGLESSIGRFPLSLSDSLRAQLNKLIEINGRLLFSKQVSQSANTIAHAILLKPHPIRVIIDATKLQLQNTNCMSISSPLSSDIKIPMHLNSKIVSKLLLSVGQNQSESKKINILTKVDKNFEPTLLIRTIVKSIMSLRRDFGMLIPDISPAVPRTIAPDALPNQIPIPQPVASELGLKAGQVISALLSGSGESLHLKLNNGRQIPLPANFQLLTGAITVKVKQIGQSFFFVPYQIGQSTGLKPDPTVSASLLNILARSGNRHMITTFLAPNIIENELLASGLPREAALLAQQRLNSQSLNASTIARALSFAGLATEHSLVNGLTLNAQSLKPWLRQILRLLPNSSELMARISESIADLESLQLEVLPLAGNRESGYAALLLFQDQKPVEMTLERQIVQSDENLSPIWVLNLYSEIERLGRIWMKAGIRENSLEMVVWTDSKTTAALAEESQFELKSSLRDNGLILESFKIFDSPRPTEDYSRGVSNFHMDLKA